MKPSSLKELNDYKEALLRYLKSGTKKEFRFLVNLKTDLDENLYRDLLYTEELISSNDINEINKTREQFEQTSKNYANSWWDDDIEQYRSGLTWESDYYDKLAQILSLKENELEKENVNNMSTSQEISVGTLMEVRGFYYDMLNEASNLAQDEDACTHFIDKWCERTGADVTYRGINVEYGTAWIDLKIGGEPFDLIVGGIGSNAYNSFIECLCYGYALSKDSTLSRVALIDLINENLDVKEAGVNIVDSDTYVGVCEITLYDSYTGMAEILSETKDSITVKYICPSPCYEQKRFHPEAYEPIVASKKTDVYEVENRSVWKKQNVLSERETYMNEEKEHFADMEEERPVKKAKSR